MDEYAEVPLSLALEVGLLTDAAWERASLDPKYQSDAAQQLSDMMKDMRFLQAAILRIASEVDHLSVAP